MLIKASSRKISKDFCNKTIELLSELLGSDRLNDLTSQSDSRLIQLRFVRTVTLVSVTYGIFLYL